MLFEVFFLSLLLHFRQHLQQQAPSLCALRHLKTGPACHSDAIASPPLDGAPKQYSPKIQQLVNDIASLTLLEVSDLNELLKVCVYILKCFSPNHNIQNQFNKHLVLCLFLTENFKHSGCWDDADGCSSSCHPGDFTLWLWILSFTRNHKI